MSGKYTEPLSDAALELIMRDVLSGLEDFSNQMEFECQMSDMKIISIKPARRANGSREACNDTQTPVARPARTRNLRLLQ